MLDFVKFVYRGILTGMPILTYNSITKNTFNVPMTVNPISTYINFKLDPVMVNVINQDIQKTSNLSLVPIKLFPDSKEEYILSVNYYNCSSPVFLNSEKEIARCEFNTYVKDGENEGTLILDYISNDLSMDPVNIIKRKDNLQYFKEDLFNIIKCNSKKENIFLNLAFPPRFGRPIQLNEEVAKFTDRVYYKNGIYDKIYYDSSLTNAIVRTPYVHKNFSFHYKGINSTSLHSIFYFVNPINFIGGMWDNVF